MKKKKQPEKKKSTETVIALTTVAMVVLAVAGFLVPPTGVIDGSVLHAMALLCIPKIITEIRIAVEQGKAVSFKHGQTSVSISDNEDNTGDE